MKRLGYVPQNIYLADDTIAVNIAFGLDKNKDQSKVEAVSKIANLYNFSKWLLENIRLLLVS